MGSGKWKVGSGRYELRRSRKSKMVNIKYEVGSTEQNTGGKYKTGAAKQL